MKTASVRFIKYHPQFAHEVDETATLSADDAKFLIDGGYAVPVSDKETATVSEVGQKAVVDTNVSDKAVKAATEQREIAHGLHEETIIASIDELGTTVELPVGTEADGNKVLIRPEDEAVAERNDQIKKAKK